jgi:hypothetical protein
MKAAGAFDQLLGTVPPRLPKSASVRLVANGKPLTDLRQLDPEEREMLRAAVNKAKAAARYQRDKQDPARMAKRKAWYERNREKTLAYKRDYDERTKVHQRRVKADWAIRSYRSDPETQRAKSRAWYAANREAILAKLQAKRDAARAAKAQELSA